MKQKIKQIFLNLGADVCGVANIDRFSDAPKGFHPSDSFEKCKSVIMFGKKLPKSLKRVNPRIIYNHANSLNLNAIDLISYEASIAIEELGHAAIPLPCDSPYEYWDKDNLVGKGLLSMRHAAVLAGLGSLGKNTLLINNQFGNFINIGCVLTDLDLQSDDLSEEICVEKCRLCLDNCPSCALDGKTVNQKQCRTYTYGTNDRGYSIINCNKCRTICPVAFGKKQ